MWRKGEVKEKLHLKTSLTVVPGQKLKWLYIIREGS